MPRNFKVTHEGNTTYLASIESTHRSERCSQLTPPLFDAVNNWASGHGGRAVHHGNWCDEAGSWSPFQKHYGYVRFDLVKETS